MSRFLLIDGTNKGKFVEAEYSHPYQDHFLFHEGIEENYYLYPFKSNDGNTYFIGSVMEHKPGTIEKLIHGYIGQK
ncbi:hypothetical protein NG99_15110 [Erwinia typographi]|uniref:Uncharacterized protein n=1 Tax=Erwinia typographi TaxID=371042 RepID=A0A0A3Z2N9_9GAMM|nr:hypothetical protein [Erwinia typographi]KGT91896.1 hypothetical protein NG99_15110 [Erwinia typographi]